MHKTDLIWGGTWGGTANFWGGMCPPRPPLGDATDKDVRLPPLFRRCLRNQAHIFTS